MNYFYKHIKTGYLISVEDLKDMRKREFTVSIKYPIQCTELSMKLKYETRMETYIISEIPFNDDFELIGFPDVFNTRELIYILTELNSGVMVNEDLYLDIKSKIINILEHQKERRFKYGY